jgi:hypothetical protein
MGLVIKNKILLVLSPIRVYEQPQWAWPGKKPTRLRQGHGAPGKQEGIKHQMLDAG